jgi:hypothetical protein
MSAVVIGLKQCPECSSEKLIPVGVGEEVNFFCRDCALCWNLKSGRPVVIDPRTCPGWRHFFPPLRLESLARRRRGYLGDASTTAQGPQVHRYACRCSSGCRGQ